MARRPDLYKKGTAMTTIDDLEARLHALEASLLRRLQILDDERELRMLLARYGFNADLGRSDAFVSLFTDDAVMDLYPDRLDPHLFVGHPELMTFITGPGHKSIEGHCQHQMEGPPMIFYIDGDEATAEGYAVTYVLGDRTPRVFSNSFNRWAFRRVDGEWRISGCHRRGMGTDQQADVFQRTTR
jgi:SnoaL-like domain